MRQSKYASKPKLTPVKQRLPKSWGKAAGLLRRQRKALERHVRMVRQEWDQHTA